MKKLAVALGLVAVVWLAWQFGMPFVVSHFLLWSRPAKPLPPETVMAEARAKANQDVTQAFQDIDAYSAQGALTHYDTGTMDDCEEGQHNWKTDAPFENRCRYLMTKFYGFNGDFRSAMVALDGVLVASGWIREAKGLLSILTGYYDRWYGPDKPKPSNMGQYLVNNIPGAQYSRGALRLFVAYRETDPTGKVLYYYSDTGLSSVSHQDGSAVDTGALCPTILETNRYILVIGIRADDYFVN